MHRDSVGAFPRAVPRPPLPLAVPSLPLAAALLGIAVAVSAAALGLWVVPMSMLVLVVTWICERRRAMFLAARRCAAVAAVDRSGEPGEAIIVADLAACAADRRILGDAQARVMSVHDPWRRLLAERRLSLATAHVRTETSTWRPTVTAGVAIAGFSAAAFVWSGSRSWILIVIACCVPLTLAVRQHRARPEAVEWLATKALLDPLKGEPPSEHEFVHLLKLLATGDQRVLLIAAQSSTPGGLAHQRLVLAASGCPR